MHVTLGDVRKSGLFFSVVIPTYNRHSNTIRAIESVLGQTYQNFEVVCVDDGSNDIKQLEYEINILNDSRILLIKHEKNRNGSAARNTGIKASRYDWIAFLDSDDEWLPHKLLTFNNNILAQKNNRDLVFYSQSKVQTMDGENIHCSVMPLVPIGENDKVADYLFCNRGFIPTPTIVVKRDTVAAVLFDESLRRHQDYDLLFRLEASGSSFYMIAEALTIVHWEDLQSSNRAFNPSTTMKFLDSHKHYMSPKSRCSFLVNQIVFSQLSRGNKRTAIKSLLHVESFRYLTFYQVVSLISLFIFSDMRVVKLLSKIKVKLHYIQMKVMN